MELVKWMFNFFEPNRETVVPFWNYAKLCFPLRGTVMSSVKSFNPMAPWRHIQWALFCTSFSSSLHGGNGRIELTALLRVLNEVLHVNHASHNIALCPVTSYGCYFSNFTLQCLYYCYLFKAVHTIQNLVPTSKYI